MDKKTWMKEFGNNLQSLLHEEGINQQQLADESNIDRADISRYINGKQMPTAKAIVNIAHALDCSADDLINYDEKIED